MSDFMRDREADSLARSHRIELNLQTLSSWYRPRVSNLTSGFDWDLQKIGDRERAIWRAAPARVASLQDKLTGFGFNELDWGGPRRQTQVPTCWSKLLVSAPRANPKG
jgi:hypothetical protein